MNKIICIPYSPSMEMKWNEAVAHAKNGTFLFHRGFMDYHKERFTDSSLIFYKSNGCVAGLFPACIDSETKVVTSHGGLTYGGFILSTSTKLIEVGEMMKLALNHYKEIGVNTVFYKAIPEIYHCYPSQDDLYWLFRKNAQLYERKAGQTIRLDKEEIPFSELRLRKIRKSLRGNSEIICSFENIADYWELLKRVLNSLHNVNPVHSLQEIVYLHKQFPQHIKLYSSLVNHRVQAGVLVFECGDVAHAQYIAASDLSRKEGLLDGLLFKIISEYRSRNFKYFDFGISTENGGWILNEGLVFQKEGFGARTICYDTYKLAL